MNVSASSPVAESRVDEHVLRQSRARLQTGFVFPLGGRLILSDRRLSFVSSRASFAHPEPREIHLDLDAINRVEIRTGDLDHMLGLSFLKRLRVVAGARSFLFQVKETQSWKKAIEELL